MKIINADGEVVASILTNASLSLPQAMALLGYPWVTGEGNDDSGYEVEGVFYGPDDLKMEY